MAWIGVVLNIIALVQSKEAGISLVGPILGIIGSALFGITATMAFPALVVLIIATVFTILHQHPAKKANPIMKKKFLYNALALTFIVTAGAFSINNFTPQASITAYAKGPNCNPWFWFLQSW